MNWNDVKKIIKREVLKEATTVNAGNTKFNLYEKKTYSCHII